MFHPVFEDKWNRNKSREPKDSTHTCTTWDTRVCACGGKCTCHWVWCSQQEDCSNCMCSEEHKFNAKDIALYCKKLDVDVMNTGKCCSWIRKVEIKDFLGVSHLIEIADYMKKHYGHGGKS